MLWLPQMADEVIHSLGKMKLTLEEEEVIKISDEALLKDIDECSQSLISKFLTCKPFNKKVAQNTLRRYWGLDEGL